ncbi:ornithine cyclodeaminase family protein [Nakamurella lactea]|uniref:ornithine cyclodeaminase family protein n=1 Tax=Nakamurella lactea TaxID=459515 RepID=UPI0004126514|nr:NAD(P)-binding domain-containing protein [Nakamurella lactea]
MHRTLLLDRAQTRQALIPDRLMAAVSHALVSISRGEDSTPARVAAFTPTGLLGAMPGYVPGLGLAAKLTSVFGVREAAGRTAHRGVVVLFDEDEGRLLAVMDAEAVTAARTAATATVAMQTLARPDAERIAVIGAGAQARAQVGYLAGLGVLSKVVVGARSPEVVRAGARFDESIPVTDIESAVRGADIVLCCTGAHNPVLCREWLDSGVHVGSVGGSEGWEIDTETLDAGTVFVEWTGAVDCPPPAGAHELQNYPADQVTVIGSVLDGRRPGRTSTADLTVFKSTGHAALDVAAAHTVYVEARRLGIGTSVDL